MTTPTEHTLMLLRHAKAAEGLGRVDHDRPLAARGRGDARAVGQWLSDPSRDAAPDLVLCSTSERTRQTLDGLIAGGALPKETRFDERIYGGGANSLLEVLNEVPDSVSSVLMIGHAPGIPLLVRVLGQDDAGAAQAVSLLSKGFPTSGLAILGFGGRWAGLAPGSAYLREFVVPNG